MKMEAKMMSFQTSENSFSEDRNSCVLHVIAIFRNTVIYVTLEIVSISIELGAVLS